MNWMILIFSIINIAIAVYIAIYICHSDKLLQMVAMGLVLFFSIYVVTTGLLFLINHFTFEVELLIQFCVEAVSSLALKVKTNYNIRDHHYVIDTAPLVLILVAILLSSAKFELFSTGQDQGLYQAEAIALMSGDYNLQHDYSEYSNLEDADEQYQYEEMVSKWTGYYELYKDVDYPTVDSEYVLSNVSGVFHGIVTWPSLMAWFGMIFCMQNMVYIQSVFFACAVILLYYAMENIGVKYNINIIMSLIFICSPLVIWISKSSMTEMFLTLLMTVYLYILSAKKIDKMYLAIPLISFSFFHISFLILVPIFFVIHIIGYSFSKNKHYLYANILMSIGLSTGYTMMANTAAQYFFDNLRQLYIGPINMDNILLVVYIGCCLIALLSILFVHEKINKLLVKLLEWKYIPRVLSLLTIIFVSYMLYHAYKVGFVLKPEDGFNANVCKYFGEGFIAFSKMTVYAFMIATGYLIVPIAIFSLMKNKWWTNIKDNNNNNHIYFLLAILFFYMIIFQSAFIRKEVYFYYYYSRYLVFYIPLICMISGISMNHYKKRNIYAIAVVSFAAMAVFDQAILRNKDDTCFEWETLLDLKEAVDEDDSAIIIGDSNLQFTIGPNLKIATNADIYPLFEDYDSEISNLLENYDNVYYLTDGEISSEFDEFLFDYSEVFTEEYKDSYYYSVGGDDAMKTTYPLDISSEKRSVSLYKYSNENEIQISLDDSLVGVGNGEKYEDGTITSNGAEGVVIFGPYVSLPQGDYQIEASINILESVDSDLADYAVYTCANDIKTTYASGSIRELLDESEDGSTVIVSFSLSEYTNSIEFVISERGGTVLQIHNYVIRKDSQDDENSKTDKEITRNVSHISVKDDAYINSECATYEDGKIVSFGKAGIVMYGPYITLSYGKYELSVPIDIIEGDLDEFTYTLNSFDSETEESRIILQGNFKDVVKISKDKTVANIQFELLGNVSKFEFIVSEEKGGSIKIDDYTIEKVDSIDVRSFDKVINIADTDQFGIGWSEALEEQRVMNAGESELFVCLNPKKDYTMKVELGETAVNYLKNIGDIDLDVYVNGNLVVQTSMNLGSHVSEYVSIAISKDCVVEGINIITLVDSKNATNNFSIKSMVFVPKK